MIRGRPINLWLSLSNAIAGALTVSAIAAGVPAEVLTPIVAAWLLVVGAIMAIVAYQPPTIAQGGSIAVQTPAGQPNATATVSVTPDTGKVVATTITPGGTS